MGEKGDNDKKDAIEEKEENKPKVSYSSLVRLEIILGSFNLSWIQALNYFIYSHKMFLYTFINFI